MIKKILKVSAVLVAVFLIAIQFFRIDKTNPTTAFTETMFATIDVPDDVRAILGRSCNDCHSHDTVYPWYSNVQPSAWILADHIEHAREDLNFSKYWTY
jgi:hypothetical protein